ncbi:IS66 family insertion sequence element accessory protein TnpA [Alkalispirochaeta americana]|uniref:IS66 family insertion sequence element accessory protein TnpA n=1 Tax=Alkalispirochaeta americana TaxID=159291 RepID=UPI003F69C813
MKAPPEHRERWQKICRDFRDSGMSQRAYCRAQGISASSILISRKNYTCTGGTMPKA